MFLNKIILHVYMNANTDPWETQETEKKTKLKKDIEKKKKELNKEEQTDKKEVKEKKLSAMAVTGFVFAFLFGPVGLVLSIIALHRIKKDSQLRGRSLALAGFILSIVFIVLPILILIIIFFVLDQAIFFKNTFG